MPNIGRTGPDPRPLVARRGGHRLSQRSADAFKHRLRAVGISRRTFTLTGVTHMQTHLTRRGLLLGIPFALSASALSAGLFSQTIPDDLDLALRRSTDASLYTVEIAPVDPSVRLGKMHAWTLGLTDKRGRPVESARIAISGGMPQHGHGLPTAPAVTQTLGEGRFLIEGMKFNMRGWWEIDLTIDGPSGTDAITFNFIL
ncbi:FixH family protein [Acidimangrovimonas sediminis]|uniref:FixH family protein n=2 Tax=Albidovulum sediminis TaxID=3066345 RepID=A0ABT2NIY0_9RHOB|nr:FixH family protein [Defluviimonas sediminis]